MDEVIKAKIKFEISKINSLVAKSSVLLVKCKTEDQISWN